MSGCESKTCSSSVVPERGRPTMKTGTSVPRPRPRVRAKNSGVQAVRSDPAARVLVVNVELCSLHLQEAQDIETALSFLLFGDGASAALVTADPGGIALRDFRNAVIPDSQDLITWHIGDHGFEMHLSGQVPGRIGVFPAGIADLREPK